MDRGLQEEAIAVPVSVLLCVGKADAVHKSDKAISLILDFGHGLFSSTNILKTGLQIIVRNAESKCLRNDCFRALNENAWRSCCYRDFRCGIWHVSI